MYSRNLLQIMEFFSMDSLTSRDFKGIAKGVGEQMHAVLMGSLHSDIILQFLAVIAAVYLFIIDRPNRRTSVPVRALLVPYLAFNLPDIMLGYIRSEIGSWVAVTALGIQLFFPTHIPPQSELPICLILLLVTAPGLLIQCRFELPGEVVSIGMGLYLLYGHISQVGGVKKAFVERGALITIGILLLLMAPVWQLVMDAFRGQITVSESFLYIMLGMTVMVSPLLLLFALPASQPGEHTD